MKSDYLHEKHFSVAEALQTLYINHSLIEKMQYLAKTLDRLGFDFRPGNFDVDSAVKENGTYPREYELLIQVLVKLGEAGIIVKGIEHGLVDFPHVRANGEEVYLCYQLGEESIHFWHSLESGYSGRKPLDEI
ncbi:MAG: DUF2203 family protein [bacterium]|nr:MAG: DUF2203 family protein [bacterium]